MKNKENFKVIGLMSGTSLDGLDITYCHYFAEENQWCYELIEATTLKLPQKIIERLRNATCLSALDMAILDVELGKWYGSEVKRFVKNKGISVDFISSHGHTIFHQPEKGLTFQIGSGYEIYVASGIPVINNFRTLDVALGGQGAPLVPMGDRQLFGRYSGCLNLGGIANISFDRGGKRLAYDICPCNMILNHLAGRAGMEYDRGGELAREGKLDADLLNKLENLGYYKKDHPKSLGSEWVEQMVFPLLHGITLDLLHTCSVHIALQIKNSMKSISGKNDDATILVTGGGAFNNFLTDLIEEKISDHIKLVIPSKRLIEFKEAIIFGFLGVLRVREEVNCLASVTGAKKDSCGGVIHGFFN